MVGTMAGVHHVVEGVNTNNHSLRTQNPNQPRRGLQEHQFPGRQAQEHREVTVTEMVVAVPAVVMVMARTVDVKTEIGAVSGRGLALPAWEDEAQQRQVPHLRLGVEVGETMAEMMTNMVIEMTPQRGAVLEMAFAHWLTQ